MAISTVTLSLGVLASVTAYSMTIPELSALLGVSENAVKLGTTFRYITWIIGLLMSGVIINRIGAKKTGLLAMVLLFVPQFLFPYITVYPLTMSLKAVQGLSGMGYIAFVVIIMNWIAEKRKGLASGILLGGFLGGGGLGGFIAGYAIPTWGWQSAFLILGLISIILTVIWFGTVRMPISLEPPEKIDSPNEKKGRWSKVFKMPETWLLSMVVFGCAWVAFAIIAELPIYMDYIGYGVTEVGNVMIAVSIAYIVSAVLGGGLSDVFAVKMKNPVTGRAVGMGIGVVAAIIGATFMPIAGSMGLGAVFIAAFMAAFGSSWPQAVYWAVPSEVYTSDLEALGTGFTGGIGNISIPVVPIVMGIILAPAWNLGWMTCTIMSILALVACLVLAKISQIRK